MYEISTLDNGFTVATATMPQMCSISLGLWFGIGSRFESARLNGICHFIEHLVFKGTSQRSAHEISQAVEGVGGYLNAFTSEELTCFHARAGHQHWLEILDVVLDMWLNPAIRASDVAKEREVIKEEISACLDDPQHHVQEVLNEILWPDQPLGRSITGTPESLDGIAREHVRKFLKNNYLASNCVLTVAGRIHHSQVLKAVAGYSPRFPQGSRPQFQSAITRQPGTICKLITKDIEQTQIAVGIRTCSRFDPQRYAIRLLNTILGENMSSRLFQIIREDHGLAYTVYSSPTFFADDGDLVISAGLDTDNLERVLKLVHRELKRLAAQLVPPSELRRARDYVIGQMDLSLEGTEAQMNWIGEQLLGHGKVLKPEGVQRRLSLVTSQDVREAAKRFFRPDRVNLAMVGPRTRIDELAKVFAGLG